MKTFPLIMSATFCLAAFPVFADATAAASSSILWAQSEVTISPNRLDIEDRVREHERANERDRVRTRLGERDRDRVNDRRCTTVTVEERGEIIRTIRRCD